MINICTEDVLKEPTPERWRSRPLFKTGGYGSSKLLDICSFALYQWTENPKPVKMVQAVGITSRPRTTLDTCWWPSSKCKKTQIPCKFPAVYTSLKVIEMVGRQILWHVFLEVCILHFIVLGSIPGLFQDVSVCSFFLIVASFFFYLQRYCWRICFWLNHYFGTWII